MSDQARWLDANRRYLMAHFARIRWYMSPAETRDTQPIDPDQIARDMPRPALLDVICQVFHLGAFERDVLLLGAGLELDSGVIAAASTMPDMWPPTVGLALRILPSAAWGPLAPDAPLRRWHLIELGHGDTLLSRPLRIDESILHILLGLDTLDPRLASVLAPVPAPDELPGSQHQAAERMAALWSGDTALPAVCLVGASPGSLRAIAAQACARHGLRLYAASAADLPDAAPDQALIARLWERHAAILGGALLIHTDGEAERRKAAAFAERASGIVIVAADEPVRPRLRATARIDIDKPLPGEQRQVWQRALGDAGALTARELDRVVAQFHMEREDIESIAAEVRSLSPGAHGSRVWSACRLKARPRLEHLAQRIEPRATWGDLVLDDRHVARLRDMVVHVRQRTRVYDDWGFAGQSGRGLGISALFAGPSGTGKTTAAEVLAGELELDLFRIDLSAVVSKYIGETEKNLRQVFDAAEAGSAILLFDEADALFGKRSEVKDSHDRYANMEVSYLLQRMEAYRGLAILTTNLRDAIDTAFSRRIRFVVEFPFPTREQRMIIWQRMFPPRAPTRDLDLGKLARLNLAGGSIRNIALAAAFIAAEDDEPIQMRHLAQAARAELVKLDRVAQEHEMRDWQ